MAAADSNQEIVGLVLNSLDGYLKSEGFESIEATVDGYKDPPTVMWKDGEEVYQPDIVAYKDESACVYEIEQCKDLEKDRVASKWKLMYRFEKPLLHTSTSPLADLCNHRQLLQYFQSPPTLDIHQGN
jgi:hypothetical protein